MKNVERILAGIFMVSVFLILIISAVEIAVYSDYSFFESEYKKYDVTNPNGIVNMEMADLMDVTREMMSYLRGNREDLVVHTIVGGEEVEFFNGREKSHMADVRDLFVGAIYIRIGAIIMAIVSLVSLIMLLYKKDVVVLIKRAYWWTIGVLMGVLAIIGIWAVVDFTGLFYKFHALFFSDYEWLLDIRTCRLINILPEGFFVDTAIRIVVIFIILITMMGMILRCIKNVMNKKTKLGGTYE